MPAYVDGYVLDHLWLLPFAIIPLQALFAAAGHGRESAYLLLAISLPGLLGCAAVLSVAARAGVFNMTAHGQYLQYATVILFLPIVIVCPFVAIWNLYVIFRHRKRQTLLPVLGGRTIFAAGTLLMLYAYSCAWAHVIGTMRR